MAWMLLFYGYLLCGLAVAVYIYCSLAFLARRADDPDEQDREMIDEMDGLAEGLRSLFGNAWLPAILCIVVLLWLPVIIHNAASSNRKE